MKGRVWREGRQEGEHPGAGAVLCLDCMVVNESTGAQMRHSTPMSSSWFWNCTVITEDATTGGNWMKGTQDLPVLSLQLL